MENKSFKKIIILVISAIILIGIGAGGCYFVIKNIPGTTIINKSEKEVTINERGIADAVEKVYDSVVVVESYKRNKLYATGSGFIFEKQDNIYYIMTNYHVIEGATDLKVKLTTQKEESVELIGGDKYSDIAILSLKSSDDLPVAEIGSSVNARVGDTVFAIGAPLDSQTYSWTVTRGILSGKDRMVSVSTNSSSYGNDYIMKVLQTDAAINSGNSGGALCNSNGQVIGITNMKLVSSGVEGMGFAIPIEDACEFAKKIIKGDDIKRPTLGVTMVELESASYYGIKVPDDIEYGVIIYEVAKDSSAADAGLKEDDIILEFEGNKIRSSAQLKYELYRHSVGETVKLKINRSGSPKEIEVKLKK